MPENAMRTLVYVHRSQAEAAHALVASLRADGQTALYRDTRGFDGDVERCDRVVTDDPVVAGAHAAKGIEVVAFTEVEPVEVPNDIPAPAAVDEGGDPILGVAEDMDGESGEGEQVGGFEGETNTPPVRKRQRRKR